MSVTTSFCQDDCRYTAPQASLASTPELFGEAPEPSTPPVLLSQTPSSEDGMEEESEQEPTLLEVLKIIKVIHSDFIGKVEKLMLDITIIRQDMHKI